MRRTSLFQFYAAVFDFRFKCIYDGAENEFVVFYNSSLQARFPQIIRDKTEFEAVENHIHLMDHLRDWEIEEIRPACKRICETLLYALKNAFPTKHFAVYAFVSGDRSLVLRFHQSWQGETDYMKDDPEAWLFFLKLTG